MPRDPQPVESEEPRASLRQAHPKGDRGGPIRRAQGGGKAVGPVGTGLAIGVREHQPVVARGGDARSQGRLFAGRCFRMVDHRQVRVIGGVCSNPVGGAICAAIVNQHPFHGPSFGKDLFAPSRPKLLEGGEVVVRTHDEADRRVNGLRKGRTGTRPEMAPSRGPAQVEGDAQGGGKGEGPRPHEGGVVHHQGA